MDIAPLNPKYKLKLDKAYGTGSGNRFRKVIVVEKSSGKTVARIDVKTRDGLHGSEETRAKIIKDFALMGLRNNQHSIDATVYENPNGETMARAAKKVSRKKAPVRRVSKKRAVKKAVKKKVTRRVPVSKKVVRKKVAVKYNPVTRYKIKIGSRYYDGGGLTVDAGKACCFTSLEQAKKIGRRVAEVTGKQVAIHSNNAKKVKKK